jgi:hypothetical protein
MTNAPTINQDSRGIATQQRNSTTRPSLRLAINEQCAYCIYDSNAPGTRLQQIEACTSKSCPLYNVRPRPTGYMAQSLIALENSELGHCSPDSEHAEV